MNYDKILVNLFWKDNHSTKAYRRFNQKINHYKNIYNYLLNRFSDSSNAYESLLRLSYNIYEIPKCPVCGCPLKFIGKPKTKGIYTKHCSMSCRQKDPNVYRKQQQASLKKYGNTNNIQKTLETKFQKYGDSTYNNKEKAKHTNLERYGVSSVLQIEEIHNKGIETAAKKESKEKRINTNIKKFGGNSPMSSEDIRNKVANTKLDRYNDSTYNNRDKAKSTIIQKYGYYYINSSKAKQTKLEKYGKSTYNNTEKNKQTCLEKYGVTHISKLPYIIEKINSSKRKNNTFNTSEPEQKSYKLLKEKYPDTIYQYKSDLYPFNCDFYIPSLDLYIECNYMWTHGGHPFDSNNKDDQLKLNKWIEKNTDFYKGAIITWTIGDVKKRNTAKQNNLNYIEFWNINELKDWLQ